MKSLWMSCKFWLLFWGFLWNSMPLLYWRQMCASTADCQHHIVSKFLRIFFFQHSFISAWNLRKYWLLYSGLEIACVNMELWGNFMRWYKYTGMKLWLLLINPLDWLYFIFRKESESKFHCYYKTPISV